MQRFMREKDPHKKTKQENIQDSHTPYIIMKFPWLSLAQAGPLNNLYINSPSLYKQVSVAELCKHFLFAPLPASEKVRLSRTLSFGYPDRETGSLCL